jgi:tetratricopeptide (TPR) repeat protein
VTGTPDAYEDRFQVEYEHVCGNEATLELSMGQLDARLANADAMTLHRRQRFDQAAEGFQRAVELDPSFDLARTNLASALARAGKVEPAATALSSMLKLDPAQAYAKILSDPDLAPLREHATVKALRAGQSGKAKIDPGRLIRSKWLARTGNLLAALHSESSWGSCAFEANLQVFDLKSGKQVAALPLAEMRDTSPDCEARRPRKPQRIAERVEVAHRFLSDLGFEVALPIEEGKHDPSAPEGKHRYRFAKAGVTLAVVDGMARVVAHDQHILLAASVPELNSVAWAAHVAGAIVFRWGRPGREGCEGSHPEGIVVLPFRSG